MWLQRYTVCYHSFLDQLIKAQLYFLFTVIQHVDPLQAQFLIT